MSNYLRVNRMFYKISPKITGKVQITGQVGNLRKIKFIFDSHLIEFIAG